MEAINDEIDLVSVIGISEYKEDRLSEKRRFSLDTKLGESLPSPVTNYEELYTEKTDFSQLNASYMPKVDDEIPPPIIKQEPPEPPKKNPNQFSREMCVFYGIKYTEY